MLDDSEKQKIIESIMQSFDKWGERYYQNLFTELNNGENSNAYEIAFSQQGFLKKRAIDIESYMYALRECNDSKIISKHRAGFIKAAIISIIRGGFTLSEIEFEKTNQNTKYTRRHKQRLIHDYYKETFFEIDSEKENVDDKRFNSFSSIFSINKLPESPMENIVTEYQKLDYELATSNRTIIDRVYHNSVLRFAFPQFLEDLLKFRDECKTVFENLGENNDRTSFLREQLVEFTPTLQIFYSHLTSILALSWFHFSSKKVQKSFFVSNFKLKYSESDAEKAKNLILLNTKDRKYTGFLLSKCALAFIDYKRPQDAILLFEQCRNLSDKVFEKGILSQNIAVQHRTNGNFKLMLGEAKTALSYCEKSDETYYVCLAHKLIGEAQYHLGFKESAINSFRNTERLANEIEQDKWKVLMNIGISFDRLGETRLRNEYLVKCLPLIPEDQTETILGIERMLGTN